MASARVYRNAVLNHTSTGNYLTLPFDTVDFDVNAPSAQWASGQPGRLTCRVAGTYLVTGVIDFASTANVGITQAAGIYMNGTQGVAPQVPAGGIWITRNIIRLTTTTQGGWALPVLSFVRMIVGDYVELLGFQSSGGNFAYNVLSGNPQYCNFSMGLVSY